jgi:hypothetical protein
LADRCQNCEPRHWVHWNWKPPHSSLAPFLGFDLVRRAVRDSSRSPLTTLGLLVRASLERPGDVPSPAVVGRPFARYRLDRETCQHRSRRRFVRGRIPPLCRHQGFDLLGVRGRRAHWRERRNPGQVRRVRRVRRLRETGWLFAWRTARERGGKGSTVEG